MVERREDPRRERWRATAFDQPGQRVQVHTQLPRQFLSKCRVEAGVAKPRAAPGDYVGRFLLGPGLLSGSKFHVLLAHPNRALLPAEDAGKRRRQRLRGAIGRATVPAAECAAPTSRRMSFMGSTLRTLGITSKLFGGRRGLGEPLEPRPCLPTRRAVYGP